MNEHDSTEPARSRWITRISIALAAIAALVVLFFIGFVVTVYVVSEKYESLHVAVWKGDAFAVRCLVLRGADVNAKGENGLTPLHWAAHDGRTEIAELLIARGADVNAKNEWGSTPLHWAADGGPSVSDITLNVAELLIAKGADINARDNKGKTPLAIATERKYRFFTALLRKHGAKEE